MKCCKINGCNNRHNPNYEYCYKCNQFIRDYHEKIKNTRCTSDIKCIICHKGLREFSANRDWVLRDMHKSCFRECSFNRRELDELRLGMLI